jgi:hypothetical protein
MRCAAVLGLILGSLAPAAFAQQPERPSIARTAQAQANDLAYFIGRWRVSALDPSAGETLEMTYVIAATDGGSWFAGVGASQDGAFNARDMWGRDPLSGEIMRVIFDGSGVFATVRGLPGKVIGWSSRATLARQTAWCACVRPLPW